MSSTVPWCAAIVAGPTSKGSRGHLPDACCQPCRTRSLSEGSEASLGWRGAAVGWGHVPGEHAIHCLQVLTARQRQRGDPHAMVVAVLQHHHGYGARGAAPLGLRVCLPSCRVRVALQHF